MRFILLLALVSILSSPVLGQDTVVAPGAVLTKAAEGFSYTEGPAWGPDGKLYFTDRARIIAWSPEEGATVFRTDPDSPNGLVFTRSGELIACETIARRVVSISRDGTEKVLADSYGGKKLNAPNDVWVDAKGGIYFTDHSMRSKVVLEQDRDHIYYITPDRSKILQLTDDLQYPNGVITNPAGDRLYVTDSGANKTYVYTINPDGSLKDKKTFAEEGYDGVSMDEKGNVYITPFANYVSVYSPDGRRIAQIPTPVRPANVCFGGKELRTLFITAGNTVYSIAMINKGLMP
jgi:gluconolactonase